MTRERAACSRRPRTPGSPAAASAPSSLLDEAAPLTADDDTAVEIARLRGYVAVGTRRCHARARGLRCRRAARRARWPRDRVAVGRGQLRRLPRRTGASRCWTTPAQRATAVASDDEGIEACAARIALGMALVLNGAGDEGPAHAARGRERCRAYEQLLGGTPLMWRWAVEAPLFLREARTARESIHALDRSGARARDRGRAVRTALPLRARRGNDGSLARGARELLRGRGARAQHRTARRGVRGALGSRLARGA